MLGTERGGEVEYADTWMNRGKLLSGRKREGGGELSRCEEEKNF